jgi:hypothetical protein
MSVQNTPEYQAFFNTYLMLRKAEASIIPYGSQSITGHGFEERAP